MMPPGDGDDVAMSLPTSYLHVPDRRPTRRSRRRMLDDVGGGLGSLQDAGVPIGVVQGATGPMVDVNCRRFSRSLHMQHMSDGDAPFDLRNQTASIPAICSGPLSVETGTNIHVDVSSNVRSKQLPKVSRKRKHKKLQKKSRKITKESRTRARKGYNWTDALHNKQVSGRNISKLKVSTEPLQEDALCKTIESSGTDSDVPLTELMKRKRNKEIVAAKQKRSKKDSK